jgi:hypothetical protein
MAARRAVLLLSALCAGVVAAPDYATVSTASFASASTCSALGPGAYAAASPLPLVVLPGFMACVTVALNTLASARAMICWL